MKTFKDFLGHIKVSEEAVSSRLINDPTIIGSIPSGVCLKQSPIHGIGVFATEDLPRDKILGLASHNNVKHTLGRFINHHGRLPNVIMIRHDADVVASTTKQIKANEEILMDYYQAYKVLQNVV